MCYMFQIAVTAIHANAIQDNMTMIKLFYPNRFFKWHFTIDNPAHQVNYVLLI